MSGLLLSRSIFNYTVTSHYYVTDTYVDSTYQCVPEPYNIKAEDLKFILKHPTDEEKDVPSRPNSLLYIFMVL